MATTRKRQTTSGAATKKVAAPEAAPAAVEDAKAAAQAVAPEAAETAPVPAAAAAAPVVEDRAAMLALFTQPQDAPAPETAAPAAAQAPEVARTGVEAEWAEEGERALVVVDLFKAVIDGRSLFAYKGTIITAPAKIIERGMRFGALSKEF